MERTPEFTRYSWPLRHLTVINRVDALHDHARVALDGWPGRLRLSRHLGPAPIARPSAPCNLHVQGRRRRPALDVYPRQQAHERAHRHVRLYHRPSGSPARARAAGPGRSVTDRPHHQASFGGVRSRAAAGPRSFLKPSACTAFMGAALAEAIAVSARSPAPSPRGCRRGSLCYRACPRSQASRRRRRKESDAPTRSWAGCSSCWPF
jgi:hypothetical protein